MFVLFFFQFKIILFSKIFLIYTNNTTICTSHLGLFIIPALWLFTKMLRFDVESSMFLMENDISIFTFLSWIETKITDKYHEDIIYYIIYSNSLNWDSSYPWSDEVACTFTIDHLGVVGTQEPRYDLTTAIFH